MKKIIAILATAFGSLLLLGGVAMLLWDLSLVDYAQLIWNLISWDQASWNRLPSLLTPLGEMWYHFHPASLNLSEAVVARYLWEDLWYEWIVVILAWPAAAVLSGLGFLILLLGKILRN